MHLFFNELSLINQCPTQTQFVEAVNHIMQFHQIARKYSRTIYCHRQMTSIQIASEKSLQQAVQQLDLNMRRSFMNWLTTTGPFWDDERQHSADEYFDLTNGTLITDTGLGEAAYRMYSGEESSVVSWPNDTWQYHPVAVNWHAADDTVCIDVANYHASEQFTAILEETQPPFQSWADLHTRCIQRFSHLTFVANCNATMLHLPFNESPAQRIYALLDMLNRFVSEHDETGKRTEAGQRYYQDWFTGQNAYFTDESDSNKSKYQQQLTFTLPDGTAIMCGMHGKPNTSKQFTPIRIHFSWPLNTAGKVYIVYIGDKITMH